MSVLRLEGHIKCSLSHFLFFQLIKMSGLTYEALECVHVLISTLFCFIIPFRPFFLRECFVIGSDVCKLKYLNGTPVFFVSYSLCLKMDFILSISQLLVSCYKTQPPTLSTVNALYNEVYCKMLNIYSN